MRLISKMMANHAHNLHEGLSLTEAARMALMRSGEQWTAMRADIFESLKAFEKPASAYDIADAVSKARGKRVAPNSVYRILDVFVGANIATRVESANAYIANAHPDCVHDCIFLVCDSCGQTTHIDNDQVSGDVRTAAEKAGFTPIRPVIEVRGTCADCD
jgi:Fur family transcriptional regulator, zinc uptake regulator